MSDSQHITTVVFVHGNALDTVYRHLPIWQKYTDTLILISPTDDPCVIDGVQCLTHAKNERIGSEALIRLLFGLRTAALHKADQYVFLEYDALMLRRPVNRPNIQGNLYNQSIFFKKHTAEMYEGTCWLHWPWILPSEKLSQFLSGIENLPWLDVKKNRLIPPRLPWNARCQDVWFTQRARELGFDLHNLLESEGFSRNTIKTSQDIYEVVKSVQAGAYALHGIKTEHVFNIIMEEFEKTNNSLQS